MRWLVDTSHRLDLTQAFAGPRRVFFVGEHWWQQVNRPTSRRFGSQEVKQHGLWYFVRMQNVDRYFTAEVPLISWWMTRRWTRLEKKTNQISHVHQPRVRYNQRSVSHNTRTDDDGDT